MVTKSLQYDVSHSHCITTLYCIIIHYSIINIELYTGTVTSYLLQTQGVRQRSDKDGLDLRVYSIASNEW